METEDTTVVKTSLNYIDLNSQVCFGTAFAKRLPLDLKA